MQQHIRYQRIIFGVDEHHRSLDVGQIVERTAPAVHLFDAGEVVHPPGVGLVQLRQRSCRCNVSFVQLVSLFDVVRQQDVPVFHDDTLHVLSQNVQIEPVEILPLKQPLCGAGIDKAIHFITIQAIPISLDLHHSVVALADGDSTDDVLGSDGLAQVLGN